MSMVVLRRSSRTHPDRQAGEPPERIVEPALGLASELDRIYLSRQERQHDFGLDARDRHPDTAVDAHAEGEVPGRAPRDVESVRVLPAPGVAVGGGEEEENLLALTELHPRDLGRACGGTKERLHRRLV